jgi:hypothetical protein
MWFRVFQSQTIMYKCSELLFFESNTPPLCHPDMLASDNDQYPIEGDVNCQRRLSCLLWAWADKDVGWQGFLRISQADPLVGSNMWESVILTYQISTSSEILIHGKQLRTPQLEGQKIQHWWKSVLSTTQYLQPVGRPTSLGDLGDIVKR